MNLLDAWTLITGMASVLSLLFALPDKYANWRRHVLPISTGLGGFALGRLSFSITGADQLLSDPSGLRALVLILAVLVALVILAYIFIRRGDTFLAYAVIVIGITGPAQLLILRQPTDIVSVDDYILLSTSKVQSHQFDTALK